MLDLPRQRLLLLLVLCLGIRSSQASERGVPAKEGILNFGQVNARLFRGAQPGAIGITNLQRLGVKTIIDLRLPDEVTKDAVAVAHAIGISCTNVPLRGVGRPTDEQVRTVLGLIDSSPGPVFVHCVHGADRTGTIIACYRIQRDKWSSKTALGEAKRYGISWLEFGMKGFVTDFAEQTARNRNTEEARR
jgi:protein tyrosine phosphatase (PTP) superfamily phosphohydrolase (DUF442 family)